MFENQNSLVVDLEKIKHNVSVLKNKDKKFFAVVKADAYGLGAVEVSKYIESEVDMFCVATINEAIELRENGIKKDILIFGYIMPENYQQIEKYNLIATIYNYDIADEMRESKFKIRAHIKVETGHNRIGFQTNPEFIEDSLKKVAKINEFTNINIEGIFTHFSSADEENREYTNMQIDLFRKFINGLGDLSKSWIKHLSNDAGIIAYNVDSDAVRSGISMYGYYPSLYMKNNYNLDLKQTFEWKSRISNIKEICSGESISYGRKFVANSNMKIATVCCGYADGYKRLISNRGYVLINGEKAKIIGAITMDQFMIDITNIDAKIHEEVILIGKSGEEVLSADTLAEWSDTISYEIMTSISKRNRRIYLR